MQHRSTPLLQRNIIILHWRAARSGDDHSCPTFALLYFRARFRVFAVFALFAFSRFRCPFSRFRGFRVLLPVFAFSRFRAKMPRITKGRDTHTHISCTAVGMMTFPNVWKVINNIPNHQPAVCWLYLDVGDISHSNQLDTKDPPFVTAMKTKMMKSI